ncbi:PREDICTED: lymphotoxin-beta [Colobus angolensis palliatus]|uniref:THD domain-containing protein n=1 Tax=Colobus angolensis palliatus TaxID=336983 RepID=A0A2K5JNF6_COLAP|nr:PREDICTED: lymphotoxin-beta [Colobus angolensis palliatus]
MGALGLEGRGGRLQGRGSLLLAVAGATSLVTLLLAVPITVLAVLALVPQDQGGLVTDTADPGAQAQQGLGFQKLPEEEPEADLSPGLPAAHLIGAPLKGQGLGWEATKEQAFLMSGTQFSDAEGLAGGAYGPGTPELLLEGAETVTPVLDPAGRQGYGPLWYTSVGFGGLVQLRRGERVYVNISHPDMVDFARGKTFFGAVMVG